MGYDPSGVAQSGGTILTRVCPARWPTWPKTRVSAYCLATEDEGVGPGPVTGSGILLLQGGLVTLLQGGFLLQLQG